MIDSEILDNDEGIQTGRISNNPFPTMIFCNPNGGYSEFFQYQSEWLDYYVN